MAGTGIVILDRELFDLTMKTLSDKGLSSSPAYEGLENELRALEEMDIDTIAGIIGKDGVEVCKIVKAIMADGKIGLGDTKELWDLGLRLIKIFNLIKDVKEEALDLSITEIQYIANLILNLYKKITQKEAAKLVGPLPKVR